MYYICIVITKKNKRFLILNFIIIMTDEAKTYVFDSARNSMDPATLLAMMNNNGFGGGNWMWIIFLFFLYCWGGNGFFGNRGGLGAEINGDYGRTLLLQAINGNGNAIGQLATTLNCDINTVQTALNALQTSIQSVGNQVGMSGMQTINAIQAGNQQLAAQLAQCCCDNKLLLTTQSYENRIANAEQTSLLGSKIDFNGANITNKIADQTALLNDKFCQLEMREMQNKIDALREERSSLMATISNEHQTAAIQNYVASVVSPIAAKVNSIEGRLPQTVTLPYSCATAVPTSAVYSGFYGNGSIFTNGAWA